MAVHAQDSAAGVQVDGRFAELVSRCWPLTYAQAAANQEQLRLAPEYIVDHCIVLSPRLPVGLDEYSGHTVAGVSVSGCRSVDALARSGLCCAVW